MNTDRIRERNRIYMKKWAALNPEKVKANQRKWREKNAERLRAVNKKYFVENKAKCMAINERWRIENPEKWLVLSARSNAKQHAAKHNALVFLTKEEKEKLNDIYARCRLMTKLTGIQHHVDHVIALSRGGKHHPENLQILTASENHRKGSK